MLKRYPYKDNPAVGVEKICNHNDKLLLKRTFLMGWATESEPWNNVWKFERTIFFHFREASSKASLMYKQNTKRWNTETCRKELLVNTCKLGQNETINPIYYILKRLSRQPTRCINANCLTEQGPVKCERVSYIFAGIRKPEFWVQHWTLAQNGTEAHFAMKKLCL